MAAAGMCHGPAAPAARAQAEAQGVLYGAWAQAARAWHSCTLPPALLRVAVPGTTPESRLHGSRRAGGAPHLPAAQAQQRRGGTEGGRMGQVCSAGWCQQETALRRRAALGTDSNWQGKAQLGRIPGGVWRRCAGSLGSSGRCSKAVLGECERLCSSGASSKHGACPARFGRTAR